MKKTILLAFAALTFASCQNNATKTTEVTDSVKLDSAAAVKPAPVASTAELTFANSTYNFGTIKKGEIVTYAFKFTNTGREPLIITDALATCGCTVPEIPKTPIKPGESGEIKVVFNSAGKPIGPLTKPVTVSSNALNGAVQITLIGEIKE
ncbi:MAG: DUF1573 domain-containing protein [Bacteroidota bacterium]